MAPPAAADPSSWDGLLLELLLLILSRLHCLADRANFAAVCSIWRYAARLAEAPLTQLPWLLFPSRGKTTFSISSFLSGTRRWISLPDDLRGARLYGSHPGGWVVASLGRAVGNVAANLISGERVPLPDMLQIDAGYLVSWYRRRCLPSNTTPLIIRAIAFSAVPTLENCVAAALINWGTQSDMAFCCPAWGQQYWSTSGWDVENLEDMVYFDGGVWTGFHVINHVELLSVFATMLPDNIIQRMTYPVQRQDDDVLPSLPESTSTSRYLVESRGRLLMVRRYYTYESDGVCQTLLFRVFQLEIQKLADGSSTASWLELNSMDGRVLFLGRSCSRAYEVPRISGFNGESIYFLDDIGFHKPFLMKHYSVGMYSRRDITRPGLIAPTSYTNLCYPLYATQTFLVCIKHNGNKEFKLFANMQDVKTYIGDRPVEVEIKGRLWRFICETTSKCPPIWFAH